jgi:cytochrome c-type biogenesis protein CcmH
VIALLVITLLAQVPDAPAAPGRAEVTIENPDDEAFRIGKLLRCPVCQGMPIAESPAPMAQDMMRRVRELVAQGKTREEILTYFEKSYEGWVRLEPKREGVNLLLWIIPPAVLAAGLFVLARALRRGRGAPTGRTAPAIDDDYVRRVREQVNE